MTWIRWDVETPRSDHLGHMSQALRLPVPHVLGLYFACVCGFGEHRRDGMVDEVSDTSLEQWAGWTGKRGVFAKAFRSYCRADGTRDDPAGSVRGWWRQRALLSKQEADALRRKPPKNPTKTRAGFTGVPDKNPTKTPEKPDKNPRATVRYGTTKYRSNNEDLLRGVEISLPSGAATYLEGCSTAPQGRVEPGHAVTR